MGGRGLKGKRPSRGTALRFPLSWEAPTPFWRIKNGYFSKGFWGLFHFPRGKGGPFKEIPQGVKLGGFCEFPNSTWGSTPLFTGGGAPFFGGKIPRGLSWETPLFRGEEKLGGCGKTPPASQRGRFVCREKSPHPLFSRGKGFQGGGNPTKGVLLWGVWGPYKKIVGGKKTRENSVQGGAGKVYTGGDTNNRHGGVSRDHNN